MNYLLVGVISYICGAVPFSYILPKLKKVDVRNVGSGNVGGTNALRAAGPLIGMTCMILDALKSFIPVLIVSRIFMYDPHYIGIAAIFAVLGHDFPIFLKFKGGKGVASTTGVFFAIYPLSGFVFLGVWISLTLYIKYVSLASIIGMYCAALVTFLFNRDIAVLFLLLATLATLRHSENIERLLKGTERKTDLISMFRKRR
ncbi:glycerol-3-phosphate 1-O-acyltransferase PlsY [Pseudothermotoga sp. U03pept]|uniref:glycerol-3-phosphate 1-O-acyltransferase PlsY n=1 Tax=Pseudothermotoga sp. U03pept TaxID=3447012 RepID=UPI003EFF3B8E